MKTSKGFTLVELLAALFILTILSIMSLKGFSSFMKQTYTSNVEKEMLDLAYRLERYKADNMSYIGFTETTVAVPRSAAGVTRPTKYNIRVVDLSVGNKLLTDTNATENGWAIRAVPVESGYPAYLINSLGTKCKNATASQVSYLSCGSGISGEKQW